MFQFLKQLIGFGDHADYAKLISEGAQIVDVRSKGEFQGGHIKGSLNIPVQELAGKMKDLNKNKPVITCCASGMRSASALQMLKSSGFKEVYNGGGWSSLQNKLR